jgi:hypothetical protein
VQQVSAAKRGDVGAQRRIFLYGGSVIIGGLGASLRREREFEVIELPEPSPGPPELAALAPDVVVFDVENSDAGPVFSLLETRPGLLLVGVSPDSDVVRIWSRRHYRALSTQDLATLIATHPSAPPECAGPAPGGGEEV